MRPMVRPGLHILRRDMRTLQLGLEWPGIAAVVDSPSVRAVLDAVDGFRDVAGVVLAAASHGVDADDATAAVEALVDAGALVDQAVLRPARVDEATWASMWLLAGRTSTAAAVLALRRTSRVYVDGTGRIADQVRALVGAEEIALQPGREGATLVVIASDHEPSRAAADDAMSDGRPFLCVGVRELVGVVGPFVVPGRTACVRCVDLSRADLEPWWSTLVDSANHNPPASGCCPPSLAAVTAGYAAQEVALWASGALPVSCDALVEIPHGLGRVHTLGYERHPYCGCGWFGEQETMGA